MTGPKTSSVMDWRSLPEWFWQLQCTYWNAVSNTFSTMTLKDFMFTPKGKDYSLILAGPPEVNKTTAMLAILKLKTVMQKKVVFLCASTLNDFGPLTLKGLTSQAAAVGFDDVDAKSG